MIVIPARYGSKRFPGKPLHLIAGRTLLERTFRIARSVTADVLIATDDPRIEEHAKAFGARVVMTDVECENGSARVLQGLERAGVSPEFVVNLQGDACLTPPWVISAILDEYALCRGVAAPSIFTPACELLPGDLEKLEAAKSAGEVSGTTVVFGRDKNALYFSKRVIPFRRSPVPVFRHIGLYGYTRQALGALMELAAGPLEQAEGLEQLRALENGIPIRVVLVDYRGRSHWSVDSPADAVRAEAIIAAEGELVP